MTDKFQALMNAVDEELLEEAMTPVKKKISIPWIGAAIAACLLLVLGSFMLPGRQSEVTAAQLSDLGYVIKLPEQAEKIRYEIVPVLEQEAAQASFVIHDTQYVYQAVKTDVQQPLSSTGTAENRVLTWNAGDVDIQLVCSGSSTSVSWYRQEEQIQWFLTANAGSMEVLTTASQILEVTGLDVTVAPKIAENITYNVFIMDDLTVAETTFQIDGITYVYRMAGTLELFEDVADISGLEAAFEENASGEVYWCSAKLSYNNGGRGKILWFDVVPGILYSLTMDSAASNEALLEMANTLFVPAQDNN